VERYATHLERVAMEVETRYCAQFQDMCSSLRLTKETAYSTFASVAQGIFSSGVNWGRVAALYAFGASLAWSMTDHGLFSLVARVADWVAQFSDQNLGEWITSRGGWVRKFWLKKCLHAFGPCKTRYITSLFPSTY
jgi:hypothetical protein